MASLNLSYKAHRERKTNKVRNISKRWSCSEVEQKKAFLKINDGYIEGITLFWKKL